MAIVILLGAAPLAALMAADRQSLGSVRAASCVAKVPSPSPVSASAAPAGEGAPQFDKNALSARESAASSRVSHSQIVKADQPALRSAFSDAASRWRLRAIFARQ